MCISCLKEKNLEYENIHCHSFYSNISTPDSVTSRKQVAERAVELGHHTISTVEHGYGGNVFDAYTIAKNLGLKLIFGTEFYYVKNRFEKDKTNSHILVVAKNENGREAMNMLISEANTTGFYMKPRIDEELLFSLPKDDVIVTTACIASPINKYDEDYAHHFLSRGKEYFGDNFFLEVQPHTHNLQIQFNKKLIEYNKKYNIDFILGVDSHYIYEKDAEMRDIFLRSKDINYPEEDGFILDFPTVDTIIDRFDVQNVLNAEQLTQAFNNTLIVRDFEGVQINDDIKTISIYPDLTHEQKTQKLKDLINREWKKDRAHIDKSEWKKYIDAIKFETDIIVGTNMEDYFLFNHKMIERGVNEYGGILTKTGRGSAPSMYVNKLFGFTEIDRIEAPIELYPTRFMSKSRILETKSLPDIDYNTAETEPFIKASKDILGDNHCYQMIAFGTMQEKDAFKSYCRGLGIPLNEVVPISEDLDSYRKHKQWGRIIERSQKFIGVITSYSPHPCANLLLNEDIRKSIGTIKAKDGQQLALIDSYNSDVYKYLKNDLLTVTVYGIIGNVYKSIGKPIDDVRTLIKNTKDDKRIWKLFEDGIVATLNQAGTHSGKPQIMQYKPKSIRDLSMWVAAIRPSFATLKDTFLTRKEFSYGIPEFDKLLKSSDNFILFQENIMTVLQYVGFPEDETYGLLKAIAKKKPGIIEPIHDRFIKGFVAKTGSENDALEVWKIIENAVGYGFNSSHAYSVALDCLYGAYLKVNYPLEYYTETLNIYSEKIDMQAYLIEELPYFNIKLKGLEFGRSTGAYNFNREENTIYKGIGTIKFLNNQVAENLQNYYDNEYNTDKTIIEVFRDIIEGKIADNRQMNILIKLGYFDSLGESNLLLELYNTMTGYQGKKALPSFLKFVGNPKIGLKYSTTLKSKDERLLNLESYCSFLIKNNIVKKYSIFDRLNAEMEYFGYPFSTVDDVSDNTYAVIDINSKYTPYLKLYNLKNGKDLNAKIDKKLAYDDGGNLLVNNGDIIEVLEIENRPKLQYIDGKWEKNVNILQVYLNKIRILNSSDI